MALKLGHHVLMSDGRKGHIVSIGDGTVEVQVAKSDERLEVAVGDLTFVKGRPARVTPAGPLTSEG